MRLGEKAENVRGHLLADAMDIEQPRPRVTLRVLRCFHLLTPRGERAIMAGEQPCRCLADLRDAERIDEAIERDPSAFVDCGDELVGADLSPTLTFHDRCGIEPEDIARLADQPVLPKGCDVLL